jgi:hypothetical protein
MSRTRIVRVTNRTLEPLDVMYDGAPDVIPAGYARDDSGAIVGAGPLVNGAYQVLTYPMEFFAAEAAKRQHPRMGTMDPNSTDARDTEYLIGVGAWGDEVNFVEQTGADELLDRSKLPLARRNAQAIDLADGARDVKGRSVARVNRSKMIKDKLAAQEKRRREYVDPSLNNPMGMRIEGLPDGPRG